MITVAANAFNVVGTQATASSPSYTGPLDLVPGAVVAYGQRAMSAAMIGQPIYTLRRSSDDAEVAYSSDASGDAPVSDISAWIGGGTGYVKTWNDQSGNTFNCTNATAANQPVWNASGPNSKPYLFDTDSNGRTLSGGAASISLTSGLTSFHVLAVPNVPFGAYEIFAFSNVSSAYINGQTYGTQALDVDYYTGANDNYSQTDAPPVFSFDTFVLVEYYVEDGVAAEIRVNGVAQSVNNTSDNVVPSVSDLSLLLSFGNQCVENIVYGTPLSSGNRTLVRQNIATYYGITL